METTPKTFSFTNIVKHYASSNEIASDGSPPAAYVDGVSSADVLCEHCDNTWRASYGDGSVRTIGRDVLVTCPNCSKSNALPFATLS
jgi:hypothetical protein